MQHARKLEHTLTAVHCARMAANNIEDRRKPLFYEIPLSGDSTGTRGEERTRRGRATEWNNRFSALHCSGMSKCHFINTCSESELIPKKYPTLSNHSVTCFISNCKNPEKMRSVVIRRFFMSVCLAWNCSSKSSTIHNGCCSGQPWLTLGTNDLNQK